MLMLLTTLCEGTLQLQGSHEMIEFHNQTAVTMESMVLCSLSIPPSHRMPSVFQLCKEILIKWQ